MPIFILFIIFSISFYLYYKTKQIRSRRHYERSLYSAKSRFALGIFILFFGLNVLFPFQMATTVDIIIAAVFILFGAFSTIQAFKMQKFYLPLAIKEREEEN